MTGRLGGVRRLWLIAAVAAVGIGLTACGEKDEAEPTTPVVETVGGGGGSQDPGGGGGKQDDQGGGKEKLSPEQQIEANIIAVVGGGDPDATCRDLVTARYVKRAYGDEQGCRAAVNDQPVFEVVVSGIEIEHYLPEPDSPTTASIPIAAAEAKPKAGPNRGETLEVRLIEDGRTWKVDYLRSNAPAGP